MNRQRVKAAILALGGFMMLAGMSVSVEAQVKPKSALSKDELYQTIAKLDAELFDAYNRCDLEKFGSFFPEQLEFYHDNGGLTDTTRASLVDSIKKNICGKVQRELVKGTLEVYPMNGYGALEIGTHLFRHPGREKEDGVGQGKFVMLWQNKEGKWQLTRIFSFDHHSAQ